MNTRMGSNKSFIEVEGERLIDRTVRILKGIFTEVMIVTNSPLEYLDLGVQIVTDIFKGKGSLGGIYTGLFHASSDLSFVTACDMPYLNSSFIEYMVKMAGKYDIVTPAMTEGPQPLHAVYSRRCLPNIKNLMDQNKLKITGFYKGMDVLSISPETIRLFDPEGRMFFNVNSPDDLKRIIRKEF
ncbi:MAG: molybdenum cofactor guanylyltransferase [Deltaproteobacteria bacterium]|nr:molybdenum cofactor guanylyltransferase [Deltaproteobacteria bacterium]